MIDFIDQHRSEHGVEPICAVLPIAPATYYAHRARQTDASKRPPRAKRDDELREKETESRLGTKASRVGS